MAQSTLNSLLKQQQQLQDELVQLGTSVGGDQRAILHDNPALDGRRNAIRAKLGRIGELENVEIIRPRLETDRVGLGNEVLVRFPDGEVETFTLLTPDDINFGSGFHNPISVRGPVGSAVLGRGAGETVVCELPEKEISLTIVTINPGGF